MDVIALMEAIAGRQRRVSGTAIRPFGITIMQYRLIRLARLRGGLSPSHAARELECDRPTMTLLARKCVASGWLSRRDALRDGRASVLELTGEGEELLDRIEAARGLAPFDQGDPLDVLEPEERRTLARYLDKIDRRSRDLAAAVRAAVKADGAGESGTGGPSDAGSGRDANKSI